MATKSRTPAADLKDEVKANASKVWLAGLGALATAEEEGGKLFRGLVKKGEIYEKKGKAQFEKLRDRVETLADAAKVRAEGAWERVGEKVGEKAGEVEERWDEKVHGVLRKIGVPSRNEIASLTDRVEKLTAMVEKKLKPSGRKTGGATRGSGASGGRKSTATRRKR